MAADLMQDLRRVTVPTPLGDLTVVVSSRGVVATVFDDDEPEAKLVAIEQRLGTAAREAPRGLADVRRGVCDYFAGRRRVLSPPPDVAATGIDGFARRVLDVTTTIPYGELWTYGDVAGMAGSPRGGRAAGNALGRCPIELFVPCHRVVHAGGSLGGYGRHEERKRWLIRHERAG